MTTGSIGSICKIWHFVPILLPPKLGNTDADSIGASLFFHYFKLFRKILFSISELWYTTNNNFKNELYELVEIYLNIVFYSKKGSASLMKVFSCVVDDISVGELHLKEFFKLWFFFCLSLHGNCCINNWF